MQVYYQVGLPLLCKCSPKRIEETPAAIIYSLEGVFATIAGWIILSQILNINNIIGCILILIAVIFSQVSPTAKKL